jgi:tetratricopeptide (TPR) repeat protein
VISSQKNALRSLVFGTVLVTAIVTAYAVSLRGEFLWDDDLHITANPTIIGPLGLKEIWTSARANYFPLVLTNFWLQHAVWGVEPLGYRIVTLAFHAVSALLLWQVLRQLRVPAPWVGAAVWALHPVQVESVAWICELKNTQSALFFLAAIWSWIQFIESDRSHERERVEVRPLAHARSYVAALVFALLAILSKPSTVMLPVALGLCAWWIRGRLVLRDAWRLAPFFALSGLAAGWTIWEQKFHSGAIGPEWSQTPFERVAIAGRVVWFYLGKLIWPEPLMFIYPRWEIDARQPLALLATIAVVAALVVLWRGRNGALRPVLFAAVYFGALLFPVLGFFSVYFFRYSFVGDHFQYLASMAPIALGAAAGARVSRRLLPYAATAVLISLGLLTARQTRVYLNNEALWRDTVAQNPAAVMAWLNLADTLTKELRYDEAMATYRHALTLRPNDPYGLNDLGNLLVLTGRPDDALSYFEKALAVKPEFPDALSNWGNALRSLGRSADAITKYRQALAAKPDHPAALVNLGAELAQAGKAAEAIALFEKALAQAPADLAAMDNLAGALREAGRIDEALARHAQVLKLNPDFPEGRANFGRTLMTIGRHAEALPHFEKALELKPRLVAARSHYANALAALGRTAEALAQLQRGVELAPQSAEAQLNFGSALAQSGRTEEAIAHFDAALEIAPDFVAAHENLGNAHFAARRWRKAVQHFEAAVKLQPESARMQSQLAVALVNDEQLAAAVPHFETALRLNPNAAEVHDNFGQVLNALGRRREAFEHLEEAARLRRQGVR